jgi:glycosyltransferase involved in cell wall biosynthesis
MQSRNDNIDRHPPVTQRILHIIPSLEYSGTSRQAARLAIALAEGGFDVHLLALFAAEHDQLASGLRSELQAGGVSTSEIGQRRPFDPYCFWRLKRHIAKLQPDLVHTWPSSANTFGHFAARMAGVKRIVSSERGVDRWKSRRRLFVDRRLARCSNRIICAGRAVHDFYTYHRVFSPQAAAGKVEVIHDGVTLPTESNISRADLLTQLTLPNDARLVGTVGRFWPRKRIKDLIWATDLLKVIRDDVHLVIIGDSPRGLPQLGWRLERFRDQVQIADRVHFVSPASLSQAFSCGVLELAAQVSPHFDAFWQGSHHEGAVVGMLEAMAAGVPVIASDIPSHREVVRSDENGLLVPVGDRAELATQTNKLLNDAQLHARLSQGARDRIATDFRFDTMVERHVSVYRDLLST